jgi:acetyltransferase-like isoleucine patch superfamily enzyme
VSSERVGNDYQPAGYMQFTAGPGLRITMRLLGALTWPITLPLALLSRLSDVVFRSCSEFLALFPYFPGVFLRYEFYRFALRGCGSNVLFESGCIFIYRDCVVGSDVLIGRNTIIHHCDIGNYVLIGEGCTLLSGSRQHSTVRTGVPMAHQGGWKKRISIGDDCWIGSQSVIMENVAGGCVVAAGSVVTKEFEEFSIIGGVPAGVIAERPAAK